MAGKLSGRRTLAGYRALASLTKELGDRQLAGILADHVPAPHRNALDSALAWIAGNTTRDRVRQWPGVGSARLRRLRSLLAERGLDFKPAKRPAAAASKRPAVARNERLPDDTDEWRRSLLESRRQLDELNADNAELDVRIERLGRVAEGESTTCHRCGATVVMADIAARMAPALRPERSPAEAAASLYGFAKAFIALDQGVCPDCNPLIPRQSCEACGARLPTASVDELADAIAALRAEGATDEQREAAPEHWLMQAATGHCAACIAGDLH